MQQGSLLSRGGSSTMPEPSRNQVDRQIIRRLHEKYGPDKFWRMMEEEIGSLSQNDSGLLVDDCVYSTSAPENASGTLSPSASVGESISGASSWKTNTNSTASPRSSKIAHRRSTSGNTRRPRSIDESSWDVEDVGSTSSAPKQKGVFTCGFCSEEDIIKTCTRKNDLKRHIEDFHHTNAQWICRHRGCEMVFDWPTAYKTHLKNTHGGSRMSLDDAKIILCPQTVYACGFENCLQVFEARSDDDADTTFKEYVTHVVKHFDEGTSSGSWTYSARLRNLLRQSAFVRVWSTPAWRSTDQSRLQWHPYSTSVLRKCLETRHIGDAHSMIHCAVQLGSEPSITQSLRMSLVTPVKDRCQMPIAGHINGIEGLSGNVTPPIGQSELFQFSVPRNVDASMMDYSPSSHMPHTSFDQAMSPRGGQSPRAAGQVMKHAVSTSGINAVTPPYGFHPSPPPSQSLFDTDQLSINQHQLMMAGQGSHGVMSAGMRQFSSGSNVKSEPDIDMSNGQVLEASYIHHYQPALSGLYDPTRALHSPTMTDGCGMTHPDTHGMEQHNPFGAYESSHAY